MRTVLLLLGIAALASAQSERGNITGAVVDQSRAAVVGATVTIVNLATNASVNAPTTTAGEYNAPNLSPGNYRIEASANGFKRFVQDNVTLTAGGTVRLDMELQVGALAETIEVTTAVAQVQTDNAKVSTAVQNKMVDELPLVVGGEMRSPYSLIGITAESKGSGQTISLGGGQAAAWDATLDGLSVATNRSADAKEIAYISPSVEAITEFSMDTNGFKAEYGQAGGGVITFSSKSGTNQFHGAAYDFLRNDKLDARGFFPAKRSVYKQNDFGGTIGGPVLIPKLYNGRDKTFFFLAYEGFRNRVGGNDQILSVPTPEMYQGDFSKWVDAKNNLIPIYDPATTRANPNGTGYVRDIFPGNRIPASRFAAFSTAVNKYSQPIAPNRAGLVPGTSGWVRNNYVVSGGSTLTPTDKGSMKIDEVLGSKHRLGFLMNMTRNRTEISPGGPPGLPVPLWTGSVGEFNTSSYRLSHDWTISARLLNHFSAGGNKFYKNTFAPASGQNWKDKVCMKNAVDCNVSFPNLSFSEFTSWGTTTYNGTEQPMWAIKDDLSFIRGKHSLKFGFAFDSQRAIGFGEQNIMGQATFSYLGTSIPGDTSTNSGSSFASYLLGDALSGATETVRYLPQMYRYYGFYAQDDWRATRKLTVNIGIRYEFTQPPINPNDQYSDFRPDVPNPAVNNYLGALVFAGFGQGRQNTRSLVPGWYGAVGPRVGLAYSLNEKTTMRAAFGRSFGKVTAVQGSGHYAGFIGQYTFSSPDQGITPAFNVDKGLPSYPLPPLIDSTFQNNQNVDYWNGQQATRAPENFFWTYSLQHQLTANMVVEIAYNATIGTHLQTGLLNLNQTPTQYLNDFVAKYGETQALNLLRADINSAQARAANIPIPYANFTNPSVQRSRTVNQALRPYPQYLTVTTGVQNGDKSGHSSYHAMVIKAERRFSSGLMFQWNYTLSKLMTDSDTYFANGSAAQDQYNRRLEKSIGQYDQTHSLKMSTLYDLPVGRGRKWLNRGVASAVLGGWRLGTIQVYSSGFPIALARNNPLPIFNGNTRPYITTYDGWRAPVAGSKFDPNVDRFLNAAIFPAQPLAAFGNSTRFNPKVRAFPSLNENISMAKSFRISEQKRVDFRWEAFNMFNRTVFDTTTTGLNNLNDKTFGLVTKQFNDPRQMQVALKLYW